MDCRWKRKYIPENLRKSFCSPPKEGTPNQRSWFCTNNLRVQKQNLTPQLGLRRALVSLKGHQPLCCNPTRQCQQMSPQSTRTAPAYQAPLQITDVSAKKAGGKESAKISHACGPGPGGLWEKPRRDIDPVLMVQLVPPSHDLEPCHSKLP